MKKNRLKIVNAVRAHKTRQCKHVRLLPAKMKARGLLWIRYYSTHGEKIYRCQSCSEELVGFIPTQVRILRKERLCSVCGEHKKVFGFWTSLPLPEGRMAYVCADCFKKVGEE